jgi:uncharacterized protein YciI
MWYVIVAEESPETLDKRLRARAEHLARLNQLQEQGKLLLAGPFPAIDSIDPGPAGYTGSLIVVDFEDLQTATEWANADPFVNEGVYTKVTVKPFRKTLP